jgi:hypothetical protein
LRGQRFVLIIRKLKHEVGGESFLIPFDLLVEAPRQHAIDLRQVGVQNDALATKSMDEIFNGLVRNYNGLGFHAVVT